jgi:hypothetical protein
MFESTVQPIEQAGLDRTLTIWLSDGAPVRVFWRGRRWRVIDTPTVISSSEAIWHPAITHPGPAWTGWRFTVADGAEVRVIDVRQVGDGWQLLAAYD